MHYDLIQKDSQTYHYLFIHKFEVFALPEKNILPDLDMSGVCEGG
ncbi:hypothetical protein [Gracilibacillus thailandensis]|nr:hypothetical protein [Gracilibacillus thailandensis]